MYHSRKNPEDRNRLSTPGALHCIDPGGIGDVTERAGIWSTEEIGITQSTPSIVDGLLYISDMAGYLHCFDAETGERYWTQDVGSRVECASQVVADGKIFVPTNRKKVYIMKAGREKKVLFIGDVEERPATPAFSDGVVYIATKKGVSAYYSPGYDVP